MTVPLSGVRLVEALRDCECGVGVATVMPARHVPPEQKAKIYPPATGCCHFCGRPLQR